MDFDEIVEILREKWEGAKEDFIDFIAEYEPLIKKTVAGLMTIPALLGILTLVNLRGRDNDKPYSIETEEPTRIVSPYAQNEEFPYDIIDPIAEKDNGTTNTQQGLTLTGSNNTSGDTFVQGQITINNSDFELSDTLEKKIKNTINNCGTTVGFYLTDVETKMTISYNADLDFLPASTVKAAMALYATKQIENGQFSYDDQMTYTKQYECAGGTPCNISKAGFGKTYTLEQIIYETIHESDNEGYYMLLDKFGYEGLNKMLTELGFKKTWLSESLKWGYYTPQELNLIWQEIYAYGMSDSEYGQKLFDTFLNAKHNFAKEHLPYSDIAHKSGFNKQGYHESAVVFGDRTYIVTVLTKTANNKKQTLGTILNLLDDATKEYAVYLEKTQENENTK